MSLKGKGKASSILTKVNEEEKQGAFAKAKARAFNQRRNLLAQESAHMICGISGDPGTGKTGLALDCRTEEERKTNWVFVLDFDEGAEPTWRQHWSSDDKVFIYNPHVYKEDMTIDYLATADMIHKRFPLMKKKLKLRQLRLLSLMVWIVGLIQQI